MARDFQKLGLDRIAVNTAKIAGAGSGNVVTGDITRGEIVEASSSTTLASVSVRSRPTGAILIELRGDSDDPKEVIWYFEGGKLFHAVNTGTAELRFWVF